jgi:hypothetical protein
MENMRDEIWYEDYAAGSHLHIKFSKPSCLKVETGNRTRAITDWTSKCYTNLDLQN